MKSQLSVSFITCVMVVYCQWMGGCKSQEIQSYTSDTATGSEQDTGSDSDVDSDSDMDADTDTDTDTDADTDTDTDTDTDSDTNFDTGSEYIDQDSDGWISSIDCDDENPDVNQGLPEIYDPPNNVDEDCDGLTDEEPGDRPVAHIPTTCDEADVGASSVGCLFYAVDSKMLGDNRPYAVFVSNVQRDTPATVVVEEKVGDAWEVAPSGGPVTIDPMTLHVFELPDKHINLSGVLAGGAYRVTSDVPIVAYQVNPFGTTSGGTGEAALLLQVPSWDSIYYVIAPQKGFEAYVTVVASVDGTVIEVTPTADIKPGPPHIPYGRVGEPISVTLDAGDVAQFSVHLGTTLMGTRVTSDEDHPVAVFYGDTCANIQGNFCDHLHEQLSGVQKWGLEFVAARMPVRSTEGLVESSFWQILASEDDTTIQFEADPSVTGLPADPIVLNAGEHWQAHVSGTVEHPGDFYVRSDKPIGLCSYMTGSSNVNEAALMDGDPSMVQISPVEQYLKRYVLLVPGSYTYDFLTIVRQTGVRVILDGNPVDDKEFIPVGLSHEVARVFVEDGVHTLEAAAGLFVTVVGIKDGADVSYAYMGGTGTKSINQVR